MNEFYFIDFERTYPTDSWPILNEIGGAFLVALIASQGVHTGTRYLTK